MKLGWARDTDKIVFAHTHQPLDGVRASDSGVRYWNSGSWIYEPDLRSPAAYRSYVRNAWPGSAVLIDSDEPHPRLLRLREHLKPVAEGERSLMLREAAEYPNSFVTLGPDEERIETGRYTLCMSSGKRWNTVQRQRFAPEELDEVLAEVRALLTERERPSTQWEIGSRAEPEGLVGLLLERGLVRDSDPVAIALALRTEPPAPPAHLVARRVATEEEYVAASEVQAVAFGTPAEELPEKRAIARDRWRRSAGTMHGVWLDGELGQRRQLLTDPLRAGAVRRRHTRACARSGCLPGAHPRPLAGGRGATRPGADHASGGDVTPDPRAARVRAGGPDRHSARRIGATGA